ncbi:putative mitochondrial protein [Tanacetum coccineum]
MPFGLTNAPSSFQDLMNSVFKAFLRRFVLVFFDDILVYSPDLETHVWHLELVLQVLRQHTIYAKQSKCVFEAENVEYLGHVITREGVTTDKSKIEAMQQWPTPTNLKQLRGFLGLTAAFDKLKQAMIEALVLKWHDFNELFVLETDASYGRIGAVLQHGGHLVAYYSKTLAPIHHTLSTYENELLAVIQALGMDGCPFDRHFKIKIDHFSLKYLLEQRITTPSQMK